LLSDYSGAGDRELAIVVEDIAAISRSAFGAIVDPHTNGGLFVGGVTAPVWFFANSAKPVLSNSTKTVYKDSLPLRKVDDPALVGRRNMN
jgi:hypothetical protein